ncbi:ABC transporter substrate-binding protein [Natrialba sp. PRR66]|uniref:ABC transporter substrate-binding protein n=1 Tax=Natrialba sp. PRR66 TaxID=3098146 RepID=UPI002B1D9BFC|nr:ABC transporter substrate-binding protein [Natrialba sp. PRR66]
MTDERRHTMDRRTALQTTLGTAALAVAGCLANDANRADFRIGSPWKPNRDPLDGGSTIRRLGITEGLVGVDYDASPAPELATDWERRGDREWEFTLREDVTFHDGEAFDATTAVDSLTRTVDAPAFEDVPIDAVEAVDETTVTVTTETPFAPLPAHLSRNEAVILSPRAVDDDGSVTETISTGPFAVESFNPNIEILTARNDDYYGQVPALESVRYEVVDDDQTRRMKLENGELEMARILPHETVDALESTGGIDVYTPPIPRIRFLAFDTDSEPFDDRRVRQAVSLAIDRKTITESLLDGLVEPAVGPFSPSITEWANPDLESNPYDPDRARTLLDDAGWTGTAGETRTRDGVELSVEFLTFDARSLPLIAEVMQDHLAAVGISVDVQTLEYSAMIDRVTQRSFDAYFTSWGTLWYPDPDRLAELYHSTAASIPHGYGNDRVDTLLEDARELDELGARRERYREVQSIVVEDAPIVVVTNDTNVIATGDDVRGYEPHPTELHYGLEAISMDSE